MPSPYRIVMNGLPMLLTAIALLSCLLFTLIAARYNHEHPKPVADPPRLIVPRDSMPTPREVRPEPARLDSILHVA